MTDHPRSRGEHTFCALLEGEGVGSSPLARGALGAGEDHAELGGIIPARAGSTGFHLLPY